MINLCLLGLQFDSRWGRGTVCFSEALVDIYWTTQHYIPKDGILLTFKLDLHFDPEDEGPICSYETLVDFYQTTQHNITDNIILIFKPSKTNFANTLGYSGKTNEDFKNNLIFGINMWYISIFLSISSHSNDVLKNIKIDEKNERCQILIIKNLPLDFILSEMNPVFIPHFISLCSIQVSKWSFPFRLFDNILFEFLISLMHITLYTNLSSLVLIVNY